ncbi:MAG TPA: hypothetical protein VKS82_09025 [Streptosporangiaceae bacterium]|nr:hypothetical protein [Streptosporangiaceae bacterium]
MTVRAGWEPFGLKNEDFDGTDARTVKVVNLRLRGGDPQGDSGRAWLRNAMIALAVLAAAAAAVSWDAQYVMVGRVKHNPVVAALEAGIPDVGALIFAALGIALALHGKRAIRARALNVACVGLSLTMNALASAPGWRDLAIWVMPSAVYALASDTLIGVIRAWVIAATRTTGQALADDEATPMAVIGGLFLWLLRLSLAPPSTIAGFRRWALEECPVAPGRKFTPPALPAPARPATQAPPRPVRARRPGKQARLLALAAERHDLAMVPLNQVSRIANTIGAEVDLSPGTARRVLLAHVRTLQNGHQHQPGSPDDQHPHDEQEPAS